MSQPKAVKLPEDQLVKEERLVPTRLENCLCAYLQGTKVCVYVCVEGSSTGLSGAIFFISLYSLYSFQIKGREPLAPSYIYENEQGYGSRVCLQ